MRPVATMYAYRLESDLLTDKVKGLYPDEIEWWTKAVSSRAAQNIGYPTSVGDMKLWVPREISFEELLEILAAAEKDVEYRIESARIHGRETRRTMSDVQGVQRKERA